jgi:hypothetical protein
MDIAIERHPTLREIAEAFILFLLVGIGAALLPFVINNIIRGIEVLI